MGIVRPIGRDRLALLGGPVAAGSGGMSCADAQNVIALNDFMVEFRAVRLPGNQCYVFYFSGGAQCSLQGVPGADQLRLNLPIASYILSNNFVGNKLIHGIVFADRSGSAYTYMSNVDGYAETGKDISGDAASNLNANNIYWGGRLGGGTSLLERIAHARLFIIDPADFPGEAERLAIASERFNHPDEESPTLARRANYATERRLDVDFVDTIETDTTATNYGTGADVTLGGALTWSSLRVQAEKAKPVPPSEDWFCLDKNAMGQNTADLGCAAGSHIVETIVKDGALGPPSTWGATITQLYAALGNERVQLNVNSSGTYLSQTRINAAWRSATISGTGASEYGRHGINVIHQVFDAAGGFVRVFVNRQLAGELTFIPDVSDLSGNVQVIFGRSTHVDGVMGLRIWNWAGAGSSLPADHEDIIQARVTLPWDREKHDFDADAIKGEWLANSTAQSEVSTDLVNLADPGTCDLALGGAYGANRVLMVGARP